ncbi:MAG TPA: SpoIID/LytB domain-containing protein [Vicinamibacteria bacterium]
MVAVWVSAWAVSMGLAASCHHAPHMARVPQPVPTAAPAPLPAPMVIPAPVIRVGILTEAGRVSIAADSGLALRGDGIGTTVQRATFVPSAAGAAAARYRVQVASFADLSAAQAVGDRARQLTGLEPTVRWSEETGTHQVRMGEFGTREEAQALLARVSAGGIQGAWIAQELRVAAAGRMRLLETGQEVGPVSLQSIVGAELVSVDGLPYRGFVEVRPNEQGSLTVVNVLNLEDYLRGVVPNELSPQAFPELEAVKAQAVAARTYALRNLGQYSARGYDICATAACQVYRGRSSEQPLSDQAVEETSGVTASYRGALINALYTSTCGGHTEDVTNIFEGDDAPYLRGVICAPERDALGTLHTAASPLAPGGEEGLTRDVALLASLGVLEGHPWTEADLKAPATGDELRRWLAALPAALGRQACLPGDESPQRRGAFFAQLVGAMCWDERARRLLAPGDTEYLLQVEDRAELSGEEALSAALLIEEGVISPFSDNTLRANARPTRAQAIAALARVALKAGVPDLRSAAFKSAGDGGLTVVRADMPETHPLDPAVRLFRLLDGNPLAASEVTVIAGEKINYLLRDGRVTYLEAEQARAGAAADRSSRVYRWEVRMTPGELAKAVSRYGSVGAVRDVTPQRYGVSGRVIELAVSGSDGELVLRGLKVRWGLGLRENLFVVDRERAPSGAIDRFVFTGKGWGHGVGLCQVGAFGMAQSGSTYDRILRHYYTGITLAKAY